VITAVRNRDSDANYRFNLIGSNSTSVSISEFFFAKSFLSFKIVTAKNIRQSLKRNRVTSEHRTVARSRARMLACCRDAPRVKLSSRRFFPPFFLRTKKKRGRNIRPGSPDAFCRGDAIRQDRRIPCTRTRRPGRRKRAVAGFAASAAARSVFPAAGVLGVNVLTFALGRWYGMVFFLVAGGRPLVRIRDGRPWCPTIEACGADALHVVDRSLIDILSSWLG
jgi:hypothetical protein